MPTPSTEELVTDSSVKFGQIPSPTAEPEIFYRQLIIKGGHIGFYPGFTLEDLVGCKDVEGQNIQPVIITGGIEQQQGKGCKEV
jgi:hypothetical protein